MKRKSRCGFDCVETYQAGKQGQIKSRCRAYVEQCANGTPVDVILTTYYTWMDQSCGCGGQCESIAPAEPKRQQLTLFG
jgi:hypothetical protein